MSEFDRIADELLRVAKHIHKLASDDEREPEVWEEEEAARDDDEEEMKKFLAEARRYGLTPSHLDAILTDSADAKEERLSREASLDLEILFEEEYENMRQSSLKKTASFKRLSTLVTAFAILAQDEMSSKMPAADLIAPLLKEKNPERMRDKLQGVISDDLRSEAPALSKNDWGRFCSRMQGILENQARRLRDRRDHEGADEKLNGAFVFSDVEAGLTGGPTLMSQLESSGQVRRPLTKAERAGRSPRPGGGQGFGRRANRFHIEDLEQLASGKWTGKVLGLPGIKSAEFRLNMEDFKNSKGKWGLKVKGHKEGSDGFFAAREALLSALIRAQ